MVKKRKLFFVLFFVVVLLAGFVSAGFFSDSWNKIEGAFTGEVVSGCVDSDGGKNPFKFGSATIGGRGMVDYCSNSNFLSEAICLDNGKVSVRFIECEYGCSGGECNTEEECSSPEGCEVSGNYCLDEDKGDFFEKGDLYIIKAGWYDNGSDLKSKKATDSCSDSNWIAEAVCKETGNYAKKFVVCPEGCKDGACIKGEKYQEALESSCWDSESDLLRGEMIHSNGYVLYGGEKYHDHCEGSFILADYYCDFFGLLQKNRVGCINSCEDGVCLRSSPKNVSEEEDKINGSLEEDPDSEEDPSPEKNPEEDDIPQEPSCLDSDSGLNYSFSGKVDYLGREYFDKCLESKEGFLVEYYCDSTGKANAFSYFCEFGCDNGRCLNEKEEEISNDKIISGEPTFCSDFGGVICSENQECSGAILEEDLELEKGEVCCISGSCSENENYFGGDCNGCFFRGECYSYGHVLNNYYCNSKVNAFKRAKEVEESCSEDYECLSGFCDHGKCSEGALKKEGAIECVSSCFFEDKCYSIGQE